MLAVLQTGSKKNEMKQETKDRIVRCVKEVLPSTTKTCIWIIKITVAVSFAMMLLK